MLIRLASGADPTAVERRLRAAGLWLERLEETGATTFRVTPPSPPVDRAALLAIDGVASVATPPSPHPCLDRQPARAVIAGVAIGTGAPPVLMAGPCAVESAEQIQRIAVAVASQGARFLRGGAFKPRTSPYSFQGHGRRALAWLRAAAASNGLAVVTECLAAADAEDVAELADLVQIGSRNMHNFDLLRAVGGTARPAMLKRGMAATIAEWRLAAEHLLHHGAPLVVLCERGIRSFDRSTRGVLDVGAIALLAGEGRLVIADPSHAAGRRDLVPALARAALAAGAAGLLVECHDDPASARSDAPQALDPTELAPLLV